MKKITIIGTGYVGLVTGACFAKMGNKVICLDIDLAKVDSLQKGCIPFYEPHLEELVKEGMRENRLQFTDQYAGAFSSCDICFLALPTPTKEDESCDLSYIFSAAQQLAKTMDHPLIVVNKSTVPVGTTEKIGQIIQETLQKEGKEIEFDLVSNPEFLREGTAVADCLHPDRILLGVTNEKTAEIMKNLYAPFNIPPEKLFVLDIASAELAKYGANAMLALRISFMNNLSLLCEKLGANIEHVGKVMGADKRIGPSYLHPGIGFGGSCLPKDVKTLRSFAKEWEVSTSLLDSILEINETQRQFFLRKIFRYFDEYELRERITLSIWGLAFKPDTDDLREAPSLYLIQECLKKGINLKIYDPVAMPKAKILLPPSPQLHFCSSPYESAFNADGIVLVTEWEEFRQIDLKKIGATLRNKALFDGRNLYDAKQMEKEGFDYLCIGKKELLKEFHASA